MKTSARPPGRRLNGQEAGARERAREREREHGVVRVDGHGVDREEPERDRGERRREAVHVVEQVERVRHPDEPEERDRAGEDVVVDELDGRPGREHDRAGGDLRGELRERAAGGRRSSTSPATKSERDRRRRAPSSACVGSNAPDGDREPEARAEPGEDADAAEHRRRALVPAVGATAARRARAASGERSERRETTTATGKATEGDERHATARSAAPERRAGVSPMFEPTAVSDAIAADGCSGAEPLSQALVHLPR